MTDRKAIGKKARFEVFKRDKFTCQYCGAKAPDAILHVDHIHPVKEGGGNEIMNLVTSCAACNGGKGGRKLADQSALEKQRVELEALEERRQQLEMMMEWRRAAGDYNALEVTALKDEVEAASGFTLNENGLKKISLWRKKFEMRELLSAIDDLFAEVVTTPEDFSAAFNKIPVVVQRKRKYGEHGGRYAYIQGILRNRFDDRHGHYIDALKQMHAEYGASIDEMQLIATTADDWDQYCRFVAATKKMGAA